jgi:hypothetical protein
LRLAIGGGVGDWTIYSRGEDDKCQMHWIRRPKRWIKTPKRCSESPKRQEGERDEEKRFRRERGIPPPKAIVGGRL